MKPYIICHMMCSLDGRIDCAMTEKIDPTNNYYEALKILDTPSRLSGKKTMAMHNAEKGEFQPKCRAPIGKKTFKKMESADGYAISVDTHGTLLWKSNIVENLPLICIVSEDAPREYAEYLERLKISWIAAGKRSIDLAQAVDLLNTEFGVRRLAVVGGGHINGSFLEAGLLDEISVMFGPAIDGRMGFAAAFDGIARDKEPYLLTFQSARQFENGTIWLRYQC